MAENQSNVHSFDETPYTQDSSLGSVGSRMKSFLKKMTNNQNFDDKRVPPAYKAYLMSKYGKVYNNDKRVDEFMSLMTDRIAARNESHKYALVEEIPEDINEYKDVLLDFFKKRGYICVDLADKIPELSKSYIFLEWGDFSRCQDDYEGQGADLEKIEENLQNA